MRIKSLSFGFGSIISLILVYFIYLYADEKGWKLLAFISKAYLIVYIVLIGIALGTFALMALLSFLVFRKAKGFKIYTFGSKPAKQDKHEKNQKEYIDVEYKIKEE